MRFHSKKDLFVIIDLDIIIWPIFFVFMSLGQYLAILTKKSLVNKGFINPLSPNSDQH